MNHQDTQARRASRAEFMTRLFVIVLVALLVGAMVTIVRIRASQVDNTNKNDARDEALALVKDCVQVGGKCYQRGQRNTAAILNSAQRIIILSAACSADVAPDQNVDQRIAAITTCVVDRLTKPSNDPTEETP